MPTEPGIPRLSWGDPSVLLGSTFSVFFSGHFYPPFVSHYKTSLLPALLALLHAGGSVNLHLCGRRWTGRGGRWGCQTSGKSPIGPLLAEPVCGCPRLLRGLESAGRGGLAPAHPSPPQSSQSIRTSTRSAWPSIGPWFCLPQPSLPVLAKVRALTPMPAVCTATLVSTGLSAPRCFLGTAWWWLFFWRPGGEDSLPRAPRSGTSRSVSHFCMRD